MSITIHAAATTIAIFSGVGLAAAQNASNHSDLTPILQRRHNQELAISTSRSAPAPDRILLIDPDVKVVTELVMDSGVSGDTTTGTNPGSSDTSSFDRPSR